MIIWVVLLLIGRIPPFLCKLFMYFKETSGQKWISKKGDNISPVSSFVLPLATSPFYTLSKGFNSQSTYALNEYE